MNTCETCAHREDIGRQWLCRVLEKATAPESGSFSSDPADFGCIYHTPKPEKRCSNCAYHQKDPCGLDSTTTYKRCDAKSAYREWVLTDPEHTCDSWRGRHSFNPANIKDGDKFKSWSESAATLPVNYFIGRDEHDFWSVWHREDHGSYDVWTAMASACDTAYDAVKQAKEKHD